MSRNTWRCAVCGKTAIRGMHFGFHPFKNFPKNPDCPHCFAKNSMNPERIKPKDPTAKPVKIKLRAKPQAAACSLTIKIKDRRIES